MLEALVALNSHTYCLGLNPFDLALEKSPQHMLLLNLNSTLWRPG